MKRSKVSLSDAERMRKSRAKFAPVRASLGVFVRKSLVDDSRACVAAIRTTARGALDSADTLSPKDRAALQTLGHARLMHLVGAALELLARQQPHRQAELIRQYMVSMAKVETDALTGTVEAVEPPNETTGEPDVPEALDALGEHFAPEPVEAVQ